MEVKVRSAWLVQFSDGQYLGTHTKPGKLDGREWRFFGRRVPFEKARIFHTYQSVANSMSFLNDPTAKSVEVFLSQPVEISKVVECAQA
jgi:hypothetical protein